MSKKVNYKIERCFFGHLNSMNRWNKMPNFPSSHILNLEVSKKFSLEYIFLQSFSVSAGLLACPNRCHLSLIIQHIQIFCTVTN